MLLIRPFAVILSIVYHALLRFESPLIDKKYTFCIIKYAKYSILAFDFGTSNVFSGRFLAYDEG